MDLNTSVDTSRKVVLEDLSKEDLIKKCKGLLTIAQKAKQTKDALLEENQELKSMLKNQNKDLATEEIIQKLTEQKLNLVTQVEEISNKYKSSNCELSEYKENLSSAQQKADQLENENISYKRQIRRLTDENEQLITHLDSLEKQIEEFKRISLQQQQALLELEQSNQLLQKNQMNIQNHEEASSKITELQSMLSISLEEVKKLKQQNTDVSEKIENLNRIVREKESELSLANQELKGKDIIVKQLKEDNNEFKETVSSRETHIKQLENIIERLETGSSSNNEEINKVVEKLKDKLKLYHSKIVKFAGSVKELKEDRNVILKQFRSYIELVSVWKSQLTLASEQLVTSVNQLQNEQTKLIEERNELIEINAKMKEHLEAHKTDDEKTKEKEQLESLQEKNKSLTSELNDLKVGTEQVIDELKKNLENADCEKTKLLKDIENLHIANKNISEQIESCTNMYTTTNESLLLKLKETEDNNIELSKQLENIEAENVQLSQEIRDVKDLYNKILQDSSGKENAVKELEELKSENTKLKRLIDESGKEHNRFESEIKSSERIIQEYEAKIREHDETSSKEIQHLKEKIQELEHFKETDFKLTERAQEEILKLVTENKELSKAVEGLTDRLQKLTKAKPKMYNSDCQTEEALMSSVEVEEQVCSLKREHSELLSEMNEMNQVLKERGETISKLEAHCEEMKKKFQIYETQANKNIDNITAKEELIRDLENEVTTLKVIQNNNNIRDSNLISGKDEIINQLKYEIDLLKEKINGNAVATYAESEAMSTSTISKTEDLNRLKDLEGSWEERYGKLRTLAVKFKSKIKELTTEVSKQKTEKEEMQQKLGNSMKTVQSLQAHCDKLEEDLEVSRKQAKEYLNKLDLVAHNITKDKERIVSDDEKITNLQQEILELKNEKQSTENWKKQLGGKVQMLRKELEANNLMRKEFESQISKFQADLEAKDQLLKAEIEAHKQTQTLLDQSNNECKKNSVLSLEMQDYEKTVKDLTQKLEKKQEMVTKLKNQVDSQKGTMSALREQYKLLEEQLKTMEKDLAVTSSEVASYRKKVNELEELVGQKQEKIQSMTQLIESARSENEELSTELSKVITEHQKVNSALKVEKEQLRNENLGLQQQLRDIQHRLQTKEEQFTILLNDYEGYKVRAQSVLRQNQNRDVGLEERLSEEVASLKSRCELLDLHLKETREQVDKLKLENERLSSEKEAVCKQHETLTNEMLNCKSQYDQLLSKHQQTINEHSETVRNLKIHSDTLVQCYRQQLSEQEARHNKEIVELQNKLDKAPSPSDLASHIVPTMPREECEGSESVESNNSTGVYPVPLERLLGNDMDQEIVHIKKQLSEQESKVAHLTALLSDTEQDLAKHVQMNKLLKEEIRRHQRSVEREKHAENLEYLKNVVFKFVTLSSGDERTRLVPVLNTILKLSPEETRKLNMVAKGDPGLKGWSNYLPLWSSPNKP